jgi:hypothetical protein
LSERPQPYVGKTGAGEGNRTLVISLEGCGPICLHFFGTCVKTSMQNRAQY